jgi:2-polyprenyl-3-methyl-5-hydroxy-6-metoxy-1,4-benzoquinol methylase
MIEDQVIEKLLRQYYKSYYSDQLGLKDWKQKIEVRIKEEENFALPIISKLEQLLNYDFAGKKVLIVGAGTGAEFIALNQKLAQVHALEPDASAIDILKAKCEKYNIDLKSVTKGSAEALPYSDETFDFVYCYTVLEHVQSVKRSMHEMVRVAKVGGYVFVETPNYRMPYEPHYKILAPMFLPRILLKLYLFLRGRPTVFINTINFISRRQILNITRYLPVFTLQILHHYPKNSTGSMSKLFYLFSHYLGIEKDFWFILVKKPGKR